MNAANSPMAGSASSGKFEAMGDPNATLDYKSLKKGANFSRTLAARASATHMDSALSIQRLERELTVEKRRNSSPMNRHSPTEISPDKKTELLIRDMSVELDDHNEREDDLQNEVLPGSCKSFYALKFRL